mmetsp:Transcript_71936/g.164982  ORF Transcript_71936/g.164982 Transcript_71936/m.164982 type:complete len:345 (+) Transcript_71936:2410-3444(+)
MPQHLSCILHRGSLRFHQFTGHEKVLHESVKMVVRNVKLVVRQPQLVVLIGHSSSESTHHKLGHLELPPLELLLGELKKVLDTRVPAEPPVHHLHDGLHIHLAPQPFHHALPIHNLGMGGDARGPAQKGSTNFLGGNNHLIHRLILHPQTGHSLLHVAQETIKLVVRESDALVDLRNVRPLVHLGPTQELGHVHVLPLLHLLDVLAYKLALHPVVHRNKIIEPVNEDNDALLSAQPLEQSILALFHVLLCKLHANGAPSGDILADLPSCCGYVLDGVRMNPELRQRFGKQVQHHVEVVIGDIHVVMCWLQIRHVVQSWAAKESAHELIHPLANVHHLSLILLKK